MSATDKKRDIYDRIPSSIEYIPRHGTEPRTLDLRALDEMAKRGAFDNMNQPHDIIKAPNTTQSIGIIARIKKILNIK